MGAVNAEFGDAENQLNRSVARTGNPAGIGGQLDALARSKGVAGGKAAGDVQIANANERDKLRAQGLDLMNSMYGTNVGASNQLYGLGPSTLQARAAGPGWSQGFKDVLSSVNPAGKVGGVSFGSQG